MPPDERLPEVEWGLLAANRLSDSLNWGATPLNTYYNKELRCQQDKVRDELEARSKEVPPEVGYVHPSIQRHVTQNFMARFSGRTMANFDHFSRRLHTAEGKFNEKQNELLEKAIWGHATPAELLRVRADYGIASIELGCLTHPYGVLTDQDKLDEMRSSVREAILLLGGELSITDPETLEAMGSVEEGLDGRDVFAVKQADNTFETSQPADYAKRLVLVTRKRMHGRLPDGTVVCERSSFDLDIGEGSKFDAKAAKRMRGIKLTHIDEKLAMKMMTEAAELPEHLPNLIAQREFSTVVPLSTTVYGFNKRTLTRIVEHEGMLNKVRHMGSEAIRQQILNADD